MYFTIKKETCYSQCHAFLSFIKFGKEEIPFGSEEPETIYVEPTDEQIKVATNFLNKITKGEHE